MSDQLSALFDQLRGQQPPAPFASPTSVRRRGRQRSRRQALAAGTAAFTAVGLAVGVPWIADLDHRPDGASPTATAGATATPTAAVPTTGVPPTASAAPPSSIGPGVPEALMLLPAEVGPGVLAEPADDLGADGPNWRWGEVMGECPGYRAADYPAQGARTAARILTYRRDAAAVAFELVERFPAGRSAAAFDEVLSLLSRCPGFETAERRVEFTVAGRDVAGDESVLVRGVSTFPAGSPHVTYYVTMRVGEFVATVEVIGGTEAGARRLGELAAARLG
jgi:hypothetical protein